MPQNNANITYHMEANGQDVSYLGALIQARAKELGETTKQAAVATAINIMKSLRANTRIANPEMMNVEIGLAKGFWAGWKTESKKRRRCVRIGSKFGTEIQKVVNLAGGYELGEVVNVYRVIDTVENAPKRSEHYLVLAKHQPIVEKYAKERHRKRVRRYSGLARFALTVAMMRTAKATQGDGALKQTTQEMKQAAFDSVVVKVNETGFNSGNVSIDVQDAVEYATQALKGGEGYVEMAVQKACNSTVGIINNKIKRVGSFNSPLKVPFPKE